MFGVKKLLASSRARDIFDKVTRYLGLTLPHLARLCLCSTFLEDGVRMWDQWDSAAIHMDNTWDCGWRLASMFVVLCIIGQLGAAAMVITRLKLDTACVVLIFIDILQMIAYRNLWSLEFLFRNLSVIGGLMMVLAENRVDGRSVSVGVSSPGESLPMMCLQLAGRVLLVLMFLTLIPLRFEMTGVQDLQYLVTVPIVLLTIGYKARISALVLMIWLNILNFYSNKWWTIPSYWPMCMRDFQKYDFFQAISVIGGLLMVVSLGPGEISVDEQKKKKARENGEKHSILL